MVVVVAGGATSLLGDRDCGDCHDVVCFRFASAVDSFWRREWLTNSGGCPRRWLRGARANSFDANVSPGER
jgi:hypothetical protein